MCHMIIKGCTVDLICRAGVQITSEGKKYTIRIAIRVGAATRGGTIYMRLLG